jgi:glycosyltransferase involved in cell wall biosynthesis
LFSKYIDKRIKYIRHDKNNRLPRALNTGFSNATGDYLTWTSDDNYYAEDAIESMVVLLQTKRMIDFVYANYYIINDDGAVLQSISVGPIETLKEYNCIGPCFFISQECL